MIVKVGDSGESSADELRRVGLIVAAFSAYPVKELAAQCQVCDEVD